MRRFLTSILIIGLSVLTALGTLWYIYNYVPLESLATEEPLRLGANITSISSTDTVKTALLTIANANFTNLNADRVATTTTQTWTALQQFLNASTSVSSCYACFFGGTATSSFSLAGVLTLITPLLPASGGTGSTTLSSNQVLLGNGTGNIKTVTGWGNSGNFLTSNGGVAAPTWQDGTVLFGSSTPSGVLGVQGNAYISGTTTITNLNLASSTPIHANGTNIQIPANLGTVGTVLSLARNLGAGNVMNGNATTTVVSVTLPADTLKVNSIMQIDAWWSPVNNGGGTGCEFGLDFGTGLSTSTIAYKTITSFIIPLEGISTKMVVTSSAQQYSYSVNSDNLTPTSYASSSTFNIASPLFLAFVARDNNSNTTCTLRGNSVTIYGN